MAKKFDGTNHSLIDKPHTPLSPHPNSHTKEEITNINKLIRRNPNISMIELYGKLRLNYSYCRHAVLFRFRGFIKRKEAIYVQKNTRKYDKMQVYIPNE